MTTSFDTPSTLPVRVHRAKISDFRPQERNANAHTQRGMGLLDRAMSEDGYVAPMTSAADNEVFDGSARLETAALRFGDDVVVVEHDGTVPIIMKRVDIPGADSPMAIRASLRANRIAQLNLSYDPEIIAAIAQEGEIDMEGVGFSQDELSKILEQAADNILGEEAPGDFKEYDEGVETEYCCPKCGYKWSGKPA